MGGGLALFTNFFFFFLGGGVDEVAYFWGEVKIFSLGFGGGATFVSQEYYQWGGTLFRKK